MLFCRDFSNAGSAEGVCFSVVPIAHVDVVHEIKQVSNLFFCFACMCW